MSPKATLQTPPRATSQSRPNPTALAAALAAAATLTLGCATAPGAGGQAAPAGSPAGASAAGGTAAAAKPAATAANTALAGATRATPPGAGASAPAAGASAAAARPPAPPPGTPPPFAEVTKGAQSTAGFLTVWTRDEKTWLEIPAERLGKPFFLGHSIASGLGQGFVLPGLMGPAPEQMVLLTRLGNNVQLRALSLHVRTQAGTPLALAVGESYSDSLLASVPLAAAPHPERKSLLVDAQALLGGDIPGIQRMFEAVFRLGYSLDRGNSSIERTRTTAEGTSLTFRNHYMVPKLPPPPMFMPGGPPPNPAMQPNPPRSLPDARSFFVSLAYTLAPLPEQPMKTRRADQRVGFFTESYTDLDDETTGDRRAHIVQRWRLEKKDPAAAISEPKQPIRVVMDRNIPEKWRPAVRDGIVEWNKAFERAGFRNALTVEQQAADADWTSFEGTRLLAVRWFAMEGPGATAVGPSQADPRTGEILRGAAIIPENWVRFDRSVVGDTTPRLGSTDAIGLGGVAGSGTADAPLPAINARGEFATRWAQCSYATDALEHMAFGLELLQLRGDIATDRAASDAYVAASLKAVVVHEVGHALGLTHNFRASTGITRAQLRDKAFTAERGTSNSVMDYNPPNIALPGEPLADVHMPGLGAYDYWAIEYGYREFASPAEEAQALARHAARGETEPALAYAADSEASAFDPLANRFDQGDDPLAYSRRQLQLARELWARTQARELAPGDTMEVYRRNLERGLSRVSQSVGVLSKYVGGAVTSRATAGANRPLVAPVPAAQQREALALLLTEVFASQSFRFEPRFMSRLGIDQRAFYSGRATDFSLPAAVLGIQRTALDNMMSDSMAQRLADAESKVSDRGQLLSYAELQESLATAVWSEITPPGKAGGHPRGQPGKTTPEGRAAAVPGEIDSLRRNLQREHVRRVAAGVLRAAAPTAADVRAVHRQVALQLEASLKAALQAPRAWTPMARAHLADSLAVLTEALKAPLNRQGV
ncbi:MAG: zinc-dependent metalloprotease [Rubrivivax sp.]|nr:zinc-dependent metalloprotease [Rubrivivax sp.]